MTAKWTCHCGKGGKPYIVPHVFIIWHALTFCWSNKSHTVSANDRVTSLEAGNPEYHPSAATSRQQSFLFSCVSFRCYWFSVWIFYGLANLLPPSSQFLPPPSLLNAVTSQRVLETTPSVYIFYGPVESANSRGRKTFGCFLFWYVWFLVTNFFFLILDCFPLTASEPSGDFWLKSSNLSPSVSVAFSSWTPHPPAVLSTRLSVLRASWWGWVWPSLLLSWLRLCQSQPLPCFSSLKACRIFALV